jgi:hypothetical protein
MLIDLKACPFCGSEAQMKYNSGSYGYTSPSYHVRCTKCFCKASEYASDLYSPATGTTYDDAGAKARATAAWNTRATPEPTLLTEEEKRDAVELVADAIATCSAGYPDEQEQAEAALSALLEKYELRRRG